MGQAVSRHRQTQSRPEPANRDSTLAEASSSRLPSSSQGTISAASKRSRRTTIRRSVLGLLPHSQSSGSLRDNVSSGSESAQPVRKLWRRSRRWSKAPVHAELAEAGQAGAAGHGVNEMGDVSAVSESSASVRPSTPALERSLVEEQHISQAIQHDLSNAVTQEQLAPHSSSRPPSLAQVHRDLEEFLSGRPTSVTDEASLPLPTIEQPASGPDLTPQAPRQFPPPGTLVVVQGVVNTTDAPSAGREPSTSTLRSSRSATPRPGSGGHLTGSLRRAASLSSATREDERLGTRNRLSSFISRSRPSSSAGNPSGADSALHRNSAAPSDLPSSTSQETISAENASSESHDESSSDNDGPARTLSPGSIDVLGTLLSVAAAATAASLFSPGLAFPLQNTNTANTDPGSNRPMSPTPTAGLGNLPGFGNMAGLDQARGPAQRDGRDRIRNVWENVRERLGLNSRSPFVSGPNSSTLEDGGDAGENRMRPGELMLAEMARALNIGLGLNDSTTAPAARSTDQDTADGASASATDDATQSAGVDNADRHLPPEDSFERFLLNLQADLRTALLQDGMGSQSERDNIPLNTASAPTHVDGPEHVAGPSDIARENEQLADAQQATVLDTESHDDDGPPPLADVSDSDSEDDDDGDDDNDDLEDEDTPRAARTPTPMPGAFPFGGDHRHDAQGERRPPGVNLWRLYRFQPIPASQTHGHAASTSSQDSSTPIIGVTSSSSPETAGTGTSPPSSSPSPSSPESSPDASGTTSSTADTNVNVVVPVIVVGLQSVDMTRNPDHIPPSHEHPHPSDEGRPSDPNLGLSDDWRRVGGASYGDSQSGTQPRGRTWQSRAANALRTLRPGRRGGSHGTRTNDSTGARTFLIYVIGGYYPPNHHMVTGSDSLDSYDALWELAELLGQVKPPVASREDIDNSGLQIIKAADLTQYEREGRVSSNCTERCLICLDDYAPEGSVRLMSCKHAFHKDCVDKWLQVGRNNCPACRTKGVSTVGEPSV